LFVAATGPFIPDAGARCSWVNNILPKNPQLDLAQPQVYVDWCEAAMYCQWAKKRLCGSRSGGQLPNSTPVASSSDAWWYACSQGGLREYAYGSYWDAGACNSDNMNSQPTDVATHAGCVGGYPGLYDMTGNVKEWIASCDNDNGNNDNCRLLGGSYNDDPSHSTCDSTDTQHRDHNTDNNIGFRCCWP
jgi:sulfatase modifying factor 1